MENMGHMHMDFETNFNTPKPASQVITSSLTMDRKGMFLRYVKMWQTLQTNFLEDLVLS